MNYWLVKSEPSAYGWTQMAKDKRTHWSGVRNPQAALYLKAMKKGDLGFFYHSNEGKEIVGIVEIVREAYPDPSDEKGRFVMVDVVHKKALPKPVTLAELKARKDMQEMGLIRQSRLSVMPVTAAQWKAILALGGAQ